MVSYRRRQRGVKDTPARVHSYQKLKATVSFDGKRRKIIISNKREPSSSQATAPPPATAAAVPDQDHHQQQQPWHEDDALDQMDDADAAYDYDDPDAADVESEDEQPQQQGQQARPNPVQQLIDTYGQLYADCSFYNTLAHGHKVCAEQQQLQALADGIQCPTCCETQLGAGFIQVHIGTQLALHRIQVHNRVCECRPMPWLPNPIQFDCLAGNTAAYAMHGSIQSGTLPLLFSRQLVADADRSYQHNKTQSIYGYVQKLTGSWLDSSKASASDAADPGRRVPCQLPYQQDTIRRRLTLAVHLYRCFEQRLHKVLQQLDGWPLGPFRPCAACVAGEIHFHYDHLFGTPLLGRTYDLGYLQPPNQDKIMDNAQVIKGLAKADADIKQGSAARAAAAAAAAAAPAAGGGASQPDAGSVAPGAVAAVMVAAQDGAVAGAAAAGAADSAAGAAEPPGAHQQAITAAAEAGRSAAFGPPAAAAAPAAAAMAGAAIGDDPCGSGTQSEVVPLSCSDFRADRLTARNSSRYLIKGLGVVACRHGHIYLMLNCFEGERHAYAITALQHLVEQGVVPRVWWYDINCRWATSFRRWLQQQPDHVQAALKDLLLPIPPWHLYAHRSECKVQHGHLHIEGTGRGSGEVCEIVNSALAPLGLTSKYMAPDTREALFERTAFVRGRELDTKLPALLLEMLLRAQRELLAVEADITKLEQSLRTMLQQQAVGAAHALPHEDTLQGLLDGAVQRAKEQLLGRSAVLAMGWQGDYVKAYLVVQRAEAIEGSTSGFHPPLSLLFPTASVDGLKISAAAIRAAKATMRRIEQQHFGGITPSISHAQVQCGVSQWVAAAVGHQKERLETTIRHVQFLNSLVQPLGTARQQSEKKKVLRQKQALQQRAEAQLKELHAAAKWALSLEDHRVVAAWEGDLGGELRKLVTTTYLQLKAALDSTAVGGLGLVDGDGVAAAAHAVAPEPSAAACDAAPEAAVPDGSGATQRGSSSSSSRRNDSGGRNQAQQGLAAERSATAYTADEAALRLYLLQLRKSHLQEEVVLVQKERRQVLDNLQTRVTVLYAHLVPPVQAQAPFSDVNGMTFLLSQELERCTALLTAAQALQDAPETGLLASLAAARVFLQGQQAIREAVDDAFQGDD